ncbi:MAG: AMP-binding protein [Proteobacteria bacterium]|nr:AMP-binding protein [Pseudomonadota bacterium]
MDFHFASTWEVIADTIPRKKALICDDVTRSWAEFDDRAACFASALSQAGLGLDAKVGLYLHNGNQYLEAQYGVFKIRGCPINVNYRYKSDELVYLLDNADAQALVFQSQYAMRIWEIRHRLPKIKLFIQVNDGTEDLLEGAVDFEQAILKNNPAPRIARAVDDVYMLYTGGTTGLPKGVMYEGGQFCFNLLALGAASRGLNPPATLAELPDYIRSLDSHPVTLPACPLMHGTGMWLGCFVSLAQGGSVVTIPRLGFNPDLLWTEVERHSVTDLVIVGDAFARPMLGALDDALSRGDPYDLTSVKQITSSGVMWSSEVKQGLLKHRDMNLVDIIGSTEGGMGSSTTSRSQLAATAKFTLNAGVKVFNDTDQEVAPGSGEMGMVASAGAPLGYYKDPEKSAQTFREIGGVRYSFPGDFATVEADGSITLLGRGSACINTAGEKVFPEEVEEAVKKHSSVVDCLVVGVPDERFGQKVVALASTRAEPPAEVEVIDFTRELLAGYKIPKHVLFVPEVRRAANGKADYKWANATALKAYGSHG